VKRPNRSRRVHIVYTFDGTWWTAEAPFLRAAYSQGRTKSSARKNLMAAIRDLLAAYESIGQQPRFVRVDVGRASLVA
jgi:predicted RNase H-like HicB family nuclease